MQAMNIMIEEHRVIERMLNALEESVSRLEKGKPVQPEFLLSVTDFIRGYADGWHHKKEEGVLFSRMVDEGIDLQGCPLGVMLAEHEAGRQYTRALASAAQAMQTGNRSAAERVIQSSRSYIALLRQHIYKEDHYLFPMAEEIIPVEKHASMTEEFEHVENFILGKAVQQKYLDLAVSLEEEMRIV